MIFLQKLMFPYENKQSIQHQVEIKADVLNFENENSIEQRELAAEELISARILRNKSQEMEITCENDRKIIKAINRKVIQGCMETVEKAQKSVTYADEFGKMTQDQDLHKKLETTHNNSWVQREQKKAGINILEAIDIKKLNSTIHKKPDQKSPYNSVRFERQNVADKNADIALAVAEKAINNLNELIERQNIQVIDIGQGYQVQIPAFI